jgi:ABC-type transporter Mla maintaining outer membrane lipid asymmetry permease subunit MlaE
VAKRSALGVGEAATSAAVLGITLIVVSDALFAVIFNLFNL